MRVLITNDDGIDAKGIKKLESFARQLSDDIYVIAPASERSGTAHSFTYRNEYQFSKIDDRHYTVEGTPADCVIVGLHHVLKETPPDLVLSGINHGDNAAYAIAYSGTFGAAFEATLHGIKSISISQIKFSNDHPQFDIFDKFMPNIIKPLIANEWPAEIAVNINLPACSVEDCQGVSVVPYAKRNIIGSVSVKEDKQDYKLLYTNCDKKFDNEFPETDLNALADNKIAITAINVDWNCSSGSTKIQSILNL